MDRITPYNWQMPTIEKQTGILETGDFCINASDTGVGKTVMALETAKRLDIPYAVVAPKITHSAWRETFKRMGAPEPIAITNAEKLQYRNPLFQKPNKWRMDAGNLLIWDELHRGCSGAKSKTSLICAWARKAGIKTLAMSATIADNPLKMRALLFHAGICGWELSSFYSFCRRHGCFMSPFHNGLQFTTGRKAVEHMKVIGDMLSSQMVRLRIDDAPGFPETLIQARLFDIDDNYRKLIDAMTLPDEWETVTDNDLVESLRQRQRTEAYKVPLLSELGKETIEEGHVPVIFVSFRHTLQELRKEFAGVRAGYIFGGQKESERTQVLSLAEKDQIDIIVLTIDAGGVGVNLQSRPGQRLRMSYISPNFNSSSVKQALGRVHRAGGQRSIQTFVLLAGTVEERVYRAIQGKLASIDAFNSVTDQDLMGL
jgi:hypothetical protein